MRRLLEELRARVEGADGVEEVEALTRLVAEERSEAKAERTALEAESDLVESERVPSFS